MQSFSFAYILINVGIVHKTGKMRGYILYVYKYNTKYIMQGDSCLEAIKLCNNWNDLALAQKSFYIFVVLFSISSYTYKLENQGIKE